MPHHGAVVVSHVTLMLFGRVQLTVCGRAETEEEAVAAQTGDVVVM